MKTIELEKFIQNLSTDLYSFAFILIPDDLQATQLMIDAVSAFMIKNKMLIDKWKNATDSEVMTHSQDIKLHLYKAMYDLSKKRYGQLRLSFKDIEDSSGFFSLEFDDKAVLFLKERFDFSLELIEFILGKTRGELLAHLYSARITMVNKLPRKLEAKVQSNVRNHN
jgi:hypothetical protein